MINPTKTLEMTAIVYLTQLKSSYYKHDNTNFYVFQGSLKKMYLNKYSWEYHQSALNPFKVVML